MTANKRRPILADAPRIQITRRQFIGLAAAAASSLALSPVARAQPSEGLTAPPWPTDGWPTANPDDLGMSGEILSQIHDFGPTTAPPANGFVVVRRGYLVYEEYFRGFTEASFNSVNSVTKSLTSMLMGIALRQGLLESVERPAADFFPEIELDDPRKRTITLRHLLTMTSGFSAESFDLADLRTADDPASVAWSRPLEHDPGDTFLYDDVAAHLLSIILTKVTGMSAAQYATKELFAPLGIWVDPEISGLRDQPDANLRQESNLPRHTLHPAGQWPEDGLPWKTDSQGHSAAGYGAHFTLREMAKLGWLYLKRGTWDGQQIVTDDWVSESTRSHSRGMTPTGMRGPAPYGYLWWLVDGRPNFFASGAGGQQIVVLPQFETVVALAVTGTNPVPGRPSAAAVVSQIVIPALTASLST